MKQEARTLVRQRAGDECEYCGIAQEFEPFLRFHIEHVIPRQHGGSDSTDNLALACPHCNFHKGTNLAGVDPETGVVVSLFHPRLDRWSENFPREGGLVVGVTAKGRATAKLLNINDAGRVELRIHLLAKR